MRSIPITRLASRCIGLAGALTCGLAAHQASAQNVTIYGLADSGVEMVTHVAAVGNKRLFRVPSITGSLPSRLGFRGKEDLGGGLNAIFVLEQGIALDQGSLNQSGRAFGRQAFVGLSGPWGTLQFGRQYSQIFFLIGDTMGPNVYSFGSLDGYFSNARLDNTVGYRSTFGDWTVGATYSLGRDAVAAPAAGGCAGETSDSHACRDYSGTIQYATATWGIAVDIERQYGGAGPGTPLPLASQTDTRSILNGFIKIAGSTIGAIYSHRENQGSITPKSNLFVLGGIYPIDLWSLEAQFSHISFKDSSFNASVVSGRVMYNFSKRTAAYFTAGHVSNKSHATYTIDGGVATGSAPLPGVNQTGVMIGMRHFF